MVRFVKERISILSRLRYLIYSFEWLSITVIDSYDHDTKQWSRVPFDFNSRFSCFINELYTAIIGYIYRVEFKCLWFGKYYGCKDDCIEGCRKKKECEELCLENME